MRYREAHDPFLLTGCRWTSWIAMYCLAVFILAMALHWSSATAVGAASSHIESTSFSIAAVTTDPDGVVETTNGEAHASCTEDEDASPDHSGACKGCCSFAGCGGFITPMVTIATTPTFMSNFPMSPLRRLTTCYFRRLSGHRSSLSENSLLPEADSLRRHAHGRKSSSSFFHRQTADEATTRRGNPSTALNKTTRMREESVEHDI